MLDPVTWQHSNYEWKETLWKFYNQAQEQNYVLCDLAFLPKVSYKSHSSRPSGRWLWVITQKWGLLWSTGMALNDHCMAGPECPLQRGHQMATTGLIPNGHWGLALNGHCNAEAPRTFCRWTDGGYNSFFPSENNGSSEAFCVPHVPLPFYFIAWKWFRYCQKGFLLGGCKSSWLSAFLGYAV